MRKNRFFVGVICGMVAGWVILFGAIALQLGRPLSTTVGWYANMQYKLNLAKSMPSPKIVFIGGSSVDAGISASLVAAETRMPAVNLGLWSPLGADYILTQAEKVLKSGDIAVLCLEYDLFDWPGPLPFWTDPQLAHLVVAHDPGYLLSRPIWEGANLVIRMPDTRILDGLFWFRPGLRPDIAESRIIGLSSHGDRTTNIPENRPHLADRIISPSAALKSGLPLEPKSWSAIQSFCRKAAAGEVHVMATFANIAQNQEYGKNAADARRIIESHYGALGVPFLLTKNKCEFPPEDCFDSNYHLMNYAVEVRTRDLLEKLKPELSRCQSTP